MDLRERIDGGNNRFIIYVDRSGDHIELYNQSITKTGIDYFKEEHTEGALIASGEVELKDRTGIFTGKTSFHPNPLPHVIYVIEKALKEDIEVNAKCLGSIVVEIYSTTNDRNGEEVLGENQSISIDCDRLRKELLSNQSSDSALDLYGVGALRGW